MVAPVDASLGFTCAALPGLIRSTAWKEEIDGALKGNSLSKEGEEEMTGGVVTLLWASKE